MKLIRMIPLLFLLSGCDDSTSSTETAIWDESSQRVVVVQDNGNVPNSEDRFITYDYSLDTLPTEAIELLPQIKTKTSDLLCVNDGVTYEVTITSDSGLESEYLSNNKACNDVKAVFVDTQQLAELTLVEMVRYLLTIKGITRACNLTSGYCHLLCKNRTKGAIPLRQMTPALSSLGNTHEIRRNKCVGIANS